MAIAPLGIDIAKSVFLLHGVDADGAVVLRKSFGAVLFLAFSASWNLV